MTHLPTVAEIIADVLGLRADGTRWNEAPKPGYNPLGKARDAN